MKCSPKEGKCYEMFSKGGNAMKFSAKEEKCFEMFSKRGKML